MSDFPPPVAPSAPSPAAAPAWISASVCTPRGETRYRRAGCGPPTLVLLEAPTPLALARCAVLARAARTYVVERPHALATEVAIEWLIDVIDALGLDHVHLVTDDACAPVAFGTRHASPARCRSVAWLACTEATPGDRGNP